MPSLIDIEPRFYRNGRRVEFDADQVTGNITWSVVDRGGYERCAVPIALPFDASNYYVQAGDELRVVAVYDDGVEIVRWAGIVTTPEATLDLRESRSIGAYGYMEDLNHVYIDQEFAVAGGVDLSWYVTKLLDIYCQRRGVTVSRDIRECGISRELVELDQSARSSLDYLMEQAAGTVTWGFEWDADLQRRRFYWRPRSPIVGYEFAVGDNVRVINAAEDHSKVKTLALLRGGVVRWPNLLAEGCSGNTSFEDFVIPREGSGNLLPDPGFEAGEQQDRGEWTYYRTYHTNDVVEYLGNYWRALTGHISSGDNRPGAWPPMWAKIGGTDPFLDPTWTYSGGASLKEDGSSEAATHSGRWMLELDSVGEKATIIVNPSPVALVEGHTLAFSTYQRREQGPDGSEGELRLTFLDAGGSAIGSAIALPLQPPSASWEEKIGQGKVPAGATGFKLEPELTVDAGEGILLDDLRVYDRSMIEQRDWTVRTFGTAAITGIDWAYPSPYHGAYCVRLSCTSSDTNDQDIHLEHAKRFPVVGNQAVRFEARLALPPGISTHGKIFLEVHSRKSDGGTTGSPTRSTIEPDTITNGWATYTAEHTFPSDAAEGLVYITFRGDCPGLLIDALSVRDAAAVANEYFPADTFERRVVCTEVCEEGTAAYAAWDKYGPREDVVENDSITEWLADAQSYMAGWFAQQAMTGAPRIEIIHDEMQAPTPASGLQVRVVGLATTMGDKWPAKVAFRVQGLMVSATIDLDEQQPSLARLLLDRDGSKQASSSGSSGGSGGSSSSGSGGVDLSAHLAAADPHPQYAMDGDVPALSDAAGAALGTAAPGMATTASRSDHVHPKPNIEALPSSLGRVTRTASGSVLDYQRGVLLLHQAYNGVDMLGTNWAIGTVTGLRGDEIAYDRVCIARVTSQSAYDLNLGTVESLTGQVAGLEEPHWRLVTCDYNSVRYVALVVPYRDFSLNQGFRWDGWLRSTAPETFRYVAYYDEDTATVLNSEIEGSITDLPSEIETYYRGALRADKYLAADGTEGWTGTTSGGLIVKQGMIVGEV